MSSILIPGSVNGPDPLSRTVTDIVRANLLTPINAVIAVLAALVLVAGSPKDALFAGVIIANSGIGIVQELRAKRTLDSLRVLTAPIARVRRPHGVDDVALDDLALGDVIEIRSGDQIPADGDVVESHHLDIDASLLTGEADPIAVNAGDHVMSGSTVIAGTGAIRVTAVAAEGYAARLTAEARRFTLVDSPLRNDVNRIVTTVGIAMVPIGIALALSQLLRTDANWQTAVIGTVAGLVGMVPEGLVLLTSVAFAVGVVRLGRRRCLVQELPAIEVLARIDVLCVDKTGTITSGNMTLVDIEEFEDGATATLASIAATDPDPNITMRAIAAALHADTPADIVDRQPFSSARRSSTVVLSDGSRWTLGAPKPDDAAARQHTMLGRRVLTLDHDERRAALVILDDEIRPDAPTTLAWFANQGVGVRVLSGDDQATVTAIAQRAGIDPGPSNDPTVLGRVDPHRKRDLVHELQAAGHTVAMTGDGVNDVLALKAADCGIAMASGAQATRAVAQLVMLDSDFAALPRVVDEGRRVINNIERVASLFLAKTTYSLVLSTVVAMIGSTYPLRPIHLTLLSWFTIGIPATVLALESDSGLVRTGFLRRVLSRAVPAGLTIAAAVIVIDAIVGGTAAVLGAGLVALSHLAIVASPLTPRRLSLVAATVIGFIAMVEIGPFRRLFELEIVRGTDLVITVAVAGLASTGLWVVSRLKHLRHRSPTEMRATH